jgi:hypothetical protein
VLVQVQCQGPRPVPLPHVSTCFTLFNRDRGRPLMSTSRTLPGTYAYPTPRVICAVSDGPAGLSRERRNHIPRIERPLSKVKVRHQHSVLLDALAVSFLRTAAMQHLDHHDKPACPGCGLRNVLPLQLRIHHRRCSVY